MCKLVIFENLFLISANATEFIQVGHWHLLVSSRAKHRRSNKSNRSRTTSTSSGRGHGESSKNDKIGVVLQRFLQEIVKTKTSNRCRNNCKKFCSRLTDQKNNTCSYSLFKLMLADRMQHLLYCLTFVHSLCVVFVLSVTLKWSCFL